jgi:hypothetical protein
MAKKPKADPSNIYPVLVLLAIAGTIAGVWLGQETWKITGLASALFFISLQLGAIYRQYTGVINLLQILNGLFMAFLRGQGVELEGSPPEEEET